MSLSAVVMALLASAPVRAREAETGGREDREAFLTVVAAGFAKWDRDGSGVPA